MSDAPMLPLVEGESDEQRRLREALNRISKDAMRSVDAAIRLRGAPSNVARQRHMARGALEEFMLRAMHAAAIKATSDTQSAQE